MNKILPKEFLIRQPSYPKVTETDPFYLAVANRLLDGAADCSFAGILPEALLKRVCLSLADYFQDIVADGGLWRSFIDANMQLYGWKVPFHPCSDDYVDYELNREDVRFLVWYVAAMLSEDLRHIYPLNADLLDFADRCYAVLDSEYEGSPEPEGWHIARGLEFCDAQDHKDIYDLGNWLFLHSYLLTPAFAMTLHDIVGSVDAEDPDVSKIVNERLEEAMLENTTGPLALFTPEWVYLMLEGKLQPSVESNEEKTIHPYYKKFTDFTGGDTIRFFRTYDEMNRFFVEALGWVDGEEHLSQAKGADNYVLMVTPYKGMLMARDICKCVKAPGNPMYDEAYARKHAFGLLTDRGLCPGDLLRRVLDEQWLPDAQFPDARTAEADNMAVVHKYGDFIARCFLQIYYRGD